MKKKFNFVVILLAIFFSITNVSAAGTANLEFIVKGTAIVGNNITVEAYLDDVASVPGGVTSMAYVLNFDDTHLEYKSVVAGSVPGPSFNDAPGQHKYLFFDMSGSGGIDSRTLVYSYTFKVLKAGTSVITGTELDATDEWADPTTISVQSASLTSSDASSNNNLSTLSVVGQTLNPAFDPSVTTYNVIVPYLTTSVNVSATAADSTASLTGTGNKSLSVGSNSVVIKVTAQNGSIKNYTLNITRSEDTRSKDNNLSSLSIKGHSITPVFSASTTSYSVVVPFSVTSGDVDTVLSDNKSSVTVTGNSDWKVGNNTVTIKVTAENGSVKNYTINVVREAEVIVELDNDATLKSLDITGQKFNPEFKSDETVYSLNVDNDVTSLDIVAITNSDKANVVITGASDLKVGVNSIVIKVTAEDNSTKNYIINVSRADEVKETVTTVKKSSDSYLKSLEIDGYKIDFNKNDNSYEVTVPFEISSLKLKYTTNNSKAKVEVSGNENFVVNGISTVELRVTAEDGSMRIYTINVLRSPLSSNNKLKDITIDGVTIDNFSADKESYKLNVNSETEVIELNAISSNSKAEVKYDKNITLQEGNNSILISVEDENGFVRYYQLDIYREIEDDLSFYFIAMYVGIGLCLLALLFVLLAVLKRRKAIKQFREEQENAMINFKPEINFNSNNGNIEEKRLIENSSVNSKVKENLPYDPYDNIVTKDELIDAIKNKDPETLKILYKQEMLNREKESLKNKLDEYEDEE